MFGLPVPEYLCTKMDNPGDVLRELLANAEIAKSTPKALVGYAFAVAREYRKQRAVWEKEKEDERFLKVAVESGALMKKRRVERKMSIADMAAAVESTSMAIARYEKGKVIPASKTAQSIRTKLQFNGLWSELYYRDEDLVVEGAKRK